MLRDDKDPSAKYFAISVALHVMVVRDRASLPVIEKWKTRARVMEEHQEVQALNNGYTYNLYIHAIKNHNVAQLKSKAGAANKPSIALGKHLILTVGYPVQNFYRAYNFC